MKRAGHFDLSVYVIIDPALCAGRDVADVAAAALRGGATMLQYRDKVNAPEVVAANALKIRAVAQGVKFLVNDHVEIARAVRADGAHLGQGDMPPARARQILGADAIIGLTAFTPAHFAALDAVVVDYAGTGPFYPTQTDKGKPVLGAAEFKKLRALSPVPVVGIGGITPQNAQAVIEAGADGVAMMRAVTEAQDPEQVVRQFVKIIRLKKAA